MARKKKNYYNKCVARFFANQGKTDVTGAVSQWNDCSGVGNNGTQGTASKRPTDNSTYLSFLGSNSQNLDCGNGASLNITDKLTCYVKGQTNQATAFQAWIDKYVGGTGGYQWGLSSAADGYKARMSVVLAKFGAFDLNSTTGIKDGVVRKIHTTVECTRKFRKMTSGLFQGEEPEVLKENGTYYWFYNKWDGSQFNIYVRSSTSPFATGSSESLLVSNATYCCINKVGSTYRLIVTSTDDHNFILYTSSAVDSGYTSSGTILTYGAAYDSFGIADPREIVIGSTYYLYYSGLTAAGVSTICYATSATGTGSYTKQGTTIGTGGSGTFDNTGLFDPYPVLLPDNTTYIMWYTGYNSSKAKQMQGYATSTDGITWTKFSGNPINWFTQPSWEGGVYGPNEPCALYENGIWRVWYRGNNTSTASDMIGYMEFSADASTYLPICGNEKVEMKIYVNNILEATLTNTGVDSIDYMLTSSQNMFIGGDGASSNYLTGDIYEAQVWNKIMKSI